MFQAKLPGVKGLKNKLKKNLMTDQSILLHGYCWEIIDFGHSSNLRVK